MVIVATNICVEYKQIQMLASFLYLRFVEFISKFSIRVL